eukprot:TRINITY_DN34302_c0_g1_i1.p2 TRINITY_DN34302_c0_g1~~TRINITY_DN34302_c0_g1_i1.p2  ORF type:complete len:110 (-),score=6.86 TRINITY_DN34302_c0_g1_i1:657-986(-)
MGLLCSVNVLRFGSLLNLLTSDKFSNLFECRNRERRLGMDDHSSSPSGKAWILLEETSNTVKFPTLTMPLKMNDIAVKFVKLLLQSFKWLAMYIVSSCCSGSSSSTMIT